MEYSFKSPSFMIKLGIRVASFMHVTHNISEGAGGQWSARKRRRPRGQKTPAHSAPLTSAALLLLLVCLAHLRRQRRQRRRPRRQQVPQKRLQIDGRHASGLRLGAVVAGWCPGPPSCRHRCRRRCCEGANVAWVRPCRRWHVGMQALEVLPGPLGAPRRLLGCHLRLQGMACMVQEFAIQLKGRPIWTAIRKVCTVDR